MKIKPIKSNQTELHMDNGTVVLFSYETPVAARLGSGIAVDQGAFVKVNRKYSAITSKHINQWLDGRRAREVSPEYLADLVNHPL